MVNVREMNKSIAVSLTGAEAGLSYIVTTCIINKKYSSKHDIAI